jgi:hypothetical protein
MLKSLPPALFALALMLPFAGSAVAASGTAMGVDPAAEAERDGGTQTLVVGADVFIGDRVVTGPSGQVQILFSDNTELVVGPRSALVIEDYLLRDDGSAGRLAVNALSGTFRFVTGGAPKDRYIITTPTGTIGVRGTAFELTVVGLLSYVLRQHGIVVLRPDVGDEVILDDSCEFGIIGEDGAEVLGNTDDVKGEDRERLKEIFAYANSEAGLMGKFRIEGATRCLKRPAGGDTPAKSISETGSGVPQTTPGGQTPPPRNNNPPVIIQ